MKLKPTPQQTFLILSMLFGETPEEREPKLGDSVVKALKGVPVRKELERNGLISVQKRGRSSHVVLEDAAWDFVAEHLGAELPRTPVAAKLLSRVLAKVQGFLHDHNHSLAEFMGSGAVGDAPKEASDSPWTASNSGAAGTNEQAVRAACLALAHNETGKRVRLKDLRERVAVARESLDQALLKMQTAGQLVLYKLDNPAEISPEDERAALFIAGEPRHLVYLES